MSSDEFVLDASALIAALDDEPGAARIRDVADRAVISAVNLGEVVAKMQERGVADDDADNILEEARLTVIPFDAALAIDAGRLRGVTRHVGLSFGDRACLALGRRLGATVLTADRAWGALDLGVTIELIR